MDMTKREHYVPEFYLKRFTDNDGKVWVYDKKHKREYKSKPTNICVQNNLYETEWTGDNKFNGKYLLQNKIENEFKKYEKDFAESLRWLDKKVVSKKEQESIEIPERIRYQVVCFITNLVHRNPKVMEKNNISEINEKRIHKDRKATLSSLLDELEIGGCDSFIVSAQKQIFLLKEIGGPIDDWIKEIMEMPITFFYNKNDMFITGDFPVIFGRETDGRYIYLPISSNSAIFISDHNVRLKNKLLVFDDKKTEKLNNFYVKYENDLIICKNNTQMERIKQMMGNN